jgi:hypothetical protein
VSAVEASKSHRTLIVANLTAATPILLQEVERRAIDRPTAFTLLVPNVQSRNAADWTLETARKLLERAAGTHVDGLLGGEDPFESVREVLAHGSYDDVIISTLPKKRSEWLRKDLPSRVEELGVSVTIITPPEEPSPLKQFTEQFSAKAPPAAGG